MGFDETMPVKMLTSASAFMYHLWYISSSEKLEGLIFGQRILTFYRTIENRFDRFKTLFTGTFLLPDSGSMHETT